MTNSIQQAAQSIIASMQRAYGGESTLLDADESHFRHLDLRFYRDFQGQHEAQGFRHLRDVEVAEISNSPTTFVARTFIRSMVSADGGTVAYYYQVKPRMGRLIRHLLRGLKNGRWLDTPRFFLRTLKTKHCTDYESELSNGHFITTSNAQSAGNLSLPSTIDSEFHPYGTSPVVVANRHRQRLDAYFASAPDVRPRLVRTVEDLTQMQRRIKAQKNAYRAAVKWVTQADLERMSLGNPLLAEAVYEEIRRQLGADGGEGRSATIQP
ncbi:hypothetical protein [Dyella acidisoli]|uniref:Uncharacterized protein n=1 Tax=Dyella acidisoli TaxID=1867834 RepID=A0ABQ5XVA2_9GAMM|nr:hypothetical protein [Dyella acidisoli]GLQ95568.1 hypothetical protein GCM10007901_45240 [Dyella acidisoli]